jgi:hypothetical protein
MPTRFPAAMRSLQKSSASFSGEQAASQRRRAFGTLSITDLPDGGASTAIEVVDPLHILQVKVA